MSIENIFLAGLRRVISERYRGYQTELASALGIKTPTFSNMVCGRRGMDEGTRREIAQRVGIDYEGLMKQHGLTNTTTVTDHSPTISGTATGSPIITQQGQAHQAAGGNFSAPGQMINGTQLNAMEKELIDTMRRGNLSDWVKIYAIMADINSR